MRVFGGFAGHGDGAFGHGGQRFGAGVRGRDIGLPPAQQHPQPDVGGL